MQEKVIGDLKRAAALVDSAIAGLTEEQASRPTIDGWSVKDHLAHMTVWHEMRFFEINRVGRGGRSVTADFGDVDAYNEATARIRRDFPLAQIIADLAFAREMVQRAVAECPENRLDSSHYREASPAGGVAHEAEHAEVISAWRQREGL